MLAPPTPENLERAASFFVHLAGTAFASGTVDHLRDAHDVTLDVTPGQPGAARRAVELHAAAHEVPNVPGPALFRYLAADRAARR